MTSGKLGEWPSISKLYSSEADDSGSIARKGVIALRAVAQALPLGQRVCIASMLASSQAIVKATHELATRRTTSLANASSA